MHEALLRVASSPHLAPTIFCNLVHSINEIAKRNLHIRRNLHLSIATITQASSTLKQVHICDETQKAHTSLKP
jgi:Trp operon repressor